MITIFTTPSCTSCRKAKKWLADQGLKFEERNLFQEPLNMNELQRILGMTEEGAEEIISERSRVFEQLSIDLESMKMTELLALLQRKPTLMRRPIIIDEKRMRIGYNADEIRCFLPREVRKAEMRVALLSDPFF